MEADLDPDMARGLVFPFLVKETTRPLTPPRLAADAYRRHLTRSLLG